MRTFSVYKCEAFIDGYKYSGNETGFSAQEAAAAFISRQGYYLGKEIETGCFDVMDIHGDDCGGAQARRDEAETKKKTPEACLIYEMGAYDNKIINYCIEGKLIAPALLIESGYAGFARFNVKGHFADAFTLAEAKTILAAYGEGDYITGKAAQKRARELPVYHDFRKAA